MCVSRIINRYYIRSRILFIIKLFTIIRIWDRWFAGASDFAGRRLIRWLTFRYRCKKYIRLGRTIFKLSSIFSFIPSALMITRLLFLCFMHYSHWNTHILLFDIVVMFITKSANSIWSHVFFIIMFFALWGLISIFIFSSRNLWHLAHRKWLREGFLSVLRKILLDFLPFLIFFQEIISGVKD